jgi:hypothetical protein
MRRKKLAGKSKELQIKGESQRRRNFGGKTECATEEEARDKVEEILASK